MLRVGQPPTAELTAYYMFAKPRLGGADEPAAVPVSITTSSREVSYRGVDAAGRSLFLFFVF